MKRGFTLPEMLVVITLIVFMVTAMATSIQRINLNARVKAAAGIVVDAAKNTRSKAISVKEFRNNIFPSYGVHFDTASPGIITVYVDCQADDNGASGGPDNTVNHLDSFRFNPSAVTCDGGNGFVENVSLPSGTKVTAIRSYYPSGGVMTEHAETKFDMLFLRPEPTIWITLTSGSLLPTGRIEVDIGDNGGKFTRTVVFYITGEFGEK